MQFSTLTKAAASVIAISPMAGATVFHATRKGPDGSLSQVAWCVIHPPFCPCLSDMTARLTKHLNFVRSNGTPDICSGFTQIVAGDGNPCGINFSVKELSGDNGPFTLQGCGGSGLTLERDGNFNSNCKFSKDKIKCDDGAVIGTGGQFICA
ncbi:hypothetical protein B0H66DRAFT_108171 [Apodospora peruviana]|uniref:Uncharacterized protein n=1 Tax=Apodospora peruviana TaxID=516989 RepID=A0AAE0IHE7_9PEZI|nr:hypothetical protein B0H66DRAFT_108171 [Apodospora peruviana]